MKNVIKYTIGLPILIIMSFWGFLFGALYWFLAATFSREYDNWVFEEICDLWRPNDR